MEKIDDRSAVKEIWPNANSWERGGINPGDSKWVIFAERHEKPIPNKIIGRGDSEAEAWASVLPAQPTVERTKAVESVAEVIPKFERHGPNLLERLTRYKGDAERFIVQLLRERDQYKAERDEARRKEVAASELLHSAKRILEDAAVGSHGRNRLAAILLLNRMADEANPKESA